MQHDLIFNKDNTGGEEIHKLIGMIDADLSFYKWEPWLKLESREVISIIGQDVFNAVVEFYYTGEIDGMPDTDGVFEVLQQKVQLSNALFAWLKIIPTLDAQHGVNGRQKRITENEKGLTSVEQYKDEANILSLAYKSLDSLLSYMVEKKDHFPFWTSSEVYTSMQSLLIPNLATFERYYKIGSFRLFVIMIPMIRGVQNRDIVTVMTQTRLNEFITAMNTAEADRTDYQIKLVSLKDYILSPLALLTMAKALKELAVQVLPEGLVQVQIIGTAKEKLRALNDAVRAKIASIENDAKIDLITLENEIGGLLGNEDPYISRARIVGNGFTF